MNLNWHYKLHALFLFLIVEFRRFGFDCVWYPSVETITIFSETFTPKRLNHLSIRTLFGHMHIIAWKSLRNSFMLRLEYMKCARIHSERKNILTTQIKMLFEGLSIYLWFNNSKYIIITIASDNRRKRIKKKKKRMHSCTAHSGTQIIIFIVVRKHERLFTVSPLGYSTRFVQLTRNTIQTQVKNDIFCVAKINERQEFSKHVRSVKLSFSAYNTHLIDRRTHNEYAILSTRHFIITVFVFISKVEFRIEFWIEIGAEFPVISSSACYAMLTKTNKLTKKNARNEKSRSELFVNVTCCTCCYFVRFLLLACCVKE